MLASLCLARYHGAKASEKLEQYSNAKRYAEQALSLEMVDVPERVAVISQAEAAARHSASAMCNGNVWNFKHVSVLVQICTSLSFVDVRGQDMISECRALCESLQKKLLFTRATAPLLAQDTSMTLGGIFCVLRCAQLLTARRSGNRTRTGEHRTRGEASTRPVAKFDDGCSPLKGGFFTSVGLKCPACGHEEPAGKCISCGAGLPWVDCNFCPDCCSAKLTADLNRS